MDIDMLVQALEERFGAGRVARDEPMAAHTTFGVGGPADAFFSPADVDELRDAIEVARAADAPWRVIGCGSNVLVADAGVSGLVIHLGGAFSDVSIEGNVLTAQAGATNEAVAEAAQVAGLTGYEFASGIPGSIGGAAIMNAGAYDGQFSDVCSAVTCLTLDGDVVEVSAAQADWGYRHSMMLDKGYVVLGATLQLLPFDKDKIRERMDDLKQRREDKQPLEYGSAGSTFKRPVGYYAGKLIEDAGMRGHRCGGAMVSEKHCGFVINYENATAADVRKVISDVQKAVLGDAGVTLETEVRMWGFED